MVCPADCCAGRFGRFGYRRGAFAALFRRLDVKNRILEINARTPCLPKLGVPTRNIISIWQSPAIIGHRFASGSRINLTYMGSPTLPMFSRKSAGAYFSVKTPGAPLMNIRALLIKSDWRIQRCTYWIRATGKMTRTNKMKKVVRRNLVHEDCSI